MEHSCSSNKHMAHHSEEFKNKLIIRLRKVEGQIRGIQKMIGDDTYCDDIITQISACRSALASVSKELFDAHLSSCVLQQIQSGSPQVIEELKKTIDRMTK